MQIENRMSISEYRQLMKKNKKSKYHSEKTVNDGIKFDSQKEASRYDELKMMEISGKISGLELQKKYILIPAQRDKDGKLLERECSYKADFYYIDENGRAVVEDTKGFRTQVYAIKKKLMLERYGIHIKEL